MLIAHLPSCRVAPCGGLRCNLRGCELLLCTADQHASQHEWLGGGVILLLLNMPPSHRGRYRRALKWIEMDRAWSLVPIGSGMSWGSSQRPAASEVRKSSPGTRCTGSTKWVPA